MSVGVGVYVISRGDIRVIIRVTYDCRYWWYVYIISWYVSSYVGLFVRCFVCCVVFVVYYVCRAVICMM